MSLGAMNVEARINITEEEKEQRDNLMKRKHKAEYVVGMYAALPRFFEELKILYCSAREQLKIVRDKILAIILLSCIGLFPDFQIGQPGKKCRDGMQDYRYP
jgi:hypothetical protein